MRSHDIKLWGRGRERGGVGRESLLINQEATGGLFWGDKETKKIKGESDSLLGQGSSWRE